MAPKRFVGFVDGENLVFRYQDLLARSGIPTRVHEHVQDRFIWSAGIAHAVHVELVRITYYAMAVGTDDDIAQLRATIAGTRYYSNSGVMADGTLQLIPRVFKKEKNTRKTRIVDINITMDVMKAAHQPSVDGILLLTGDGDFVSLAHEITRNTGKQLIVAGFSGGLETELTSAADRFIDLDPIFFSP